MESVRQMKNRHGWIVKMSVKQEIYHCLRNLKEADQADKGNEYVLH